MDARRGALCPRQRPALLLAALMLIVPLAGCAEPDVPPEESNPPTNDTDPTPPTNDVGATGMLLVENLRIENEEKSARLHEDDRVFVRYTIRHPGEPDSATTRFVSLVVDGEVVDVENVRLEPGASKSYEYEVKNVRDRTKVHVEVRIAPSKTTADATIEAWPRTGETVDLGNLTVRVNRWLKNDTDGGTDVNITIIRPADPNVGLTNFRANVLCINDKGEIRKDGDARPQLPEPGASGMHNLHLPGCSDTLYGVRFKMEADGEGAEQRVLFVEREWRPVNERA